MSDDEEPKTASQELKEAASHLRSAASLIWERALSDPTALRTTERIVTEVSERAEPIAKQVSSSVLHASKQILEWAVPTSDESSPTSEDEPDNEGDDA